MKTFTAEQFNKSPAQVYREADKNGGVIIIHKQYPDGFLLRVPVPTAPKTAPASRLSTPQD